MDLSSIIGFIVVIIIIVVILKVFKSIFKALFTISTLLGIVIFIFMMILYQDVSDFQTNFPISEKLFLLEENNTLLAGFSGTFTEETQPDLVTENELDSYQSSFEENDLEAILGNYYKLFIVKLDVFKDTKSIEFGDDALSVNFVFDLLYSNSPIDKYANYYIQSQGIPASALENVKKQLRNTFSSDEEFKGALFATLFGEETQANSLFLFEEYKKDNIIIYEETILFRTIKKLPFFLMKRFVKTENGAA